MTTATSAPATSALTESTRTPTYRFSAVTVARTQLLGPSCQRLTLAGPDLTGFGVGGDDQRIKLVLSRGGAPVAELLTDGPDWYRAYSCWVPTGRAAAAPGGAPPDDGPLLLAGDETAVPAIGAILEALPAGRPTVAVVEVPTAGDILQLSVAPQVQVRWLGLLAARRGREALIPVRHGVRCPTVGAQGAGRLPVREGAAVLRVVVALVALLFAAWVLLGVLSWVVTGLFWLGVVGIVVLVASALLDPTRRRRRPR